MRAKIGRGLLTFVALFTSMGPFLADWDATHIYNPDRPPHAKFHNGQTMAMGLLLGLATLYFLWRRRGAPSTNLLSAGILLAIYWVGQMAAFLYPGTSYADPRFVGPEGLAAVPPQFVLECVALAVIAVGLFLFRPSGTPHARRSAGAPKRRLSRGRFQARTHPQRRSPRLPGVLSSPRATGDDA